MPTQRSLLSRSNFKLIGSQVELYVSSENLMSNRIFLGVVTLVADMSCVSAERS